MRAPTRELVNAIACGNALGGTDPRTGGHRPENRRWAPTREPEGTNPRTGECDCVWQCAMVKRGNGEPENRDVDQPALVGRGPEAVIACLIPSAHECSDTVKSTDLS